MVEVQYEPHEDDCILLVKHLVNSESLSQSPMTVLPAMALSKLVQPLEMLPRNLISERARKELLA